MGPRMIAAVLAGPRRIELAEIARPMPGPGEVLVRLEGCGLCGSSLPAWQGREELRYPLAPGAPGHEGWGRIAALGRGVEEHAEGDRVALLSFAAFADYDVAPADRALEIPDAVRGPFPGEALGSAVSVAHRAGIEQGDTVAVVGAGFVGLVALRVASLAGARVLALSRRPTALALSRALGADEAISTADPAAAEARVRELTGGRGCDVVIEAVGLQASLDLATRLAGDGGRLAIAGSHEDGLRTVDLRTCGRRGIEVVDVHESELAVQREGVLAAARLVAEGRLDPAPLYRCFPLERLADAFRAMEERPEGFLKALVTT
jgi:threonine dehydrogenase-like Zn-dependent dehydrogenase